MGIEDFYLGSCQGWPWFSQRTPFKCPVCEGRGVVPAGFYIPNETFALTSTSPETCQSCNGQGIVWN